MHHLEKIHILINEQGHIQDTLVNENDNIYRRNYKKSQTILIS